MNLAQLLEHAESATLAFPTSADSAIRLQKELSNPDCHSAEITRLLLSEPTLSTSAVAMANSAMFARGQDRTVTGVRAAVDRLGHRNLFSLATAAVIRQMNSAIKDSSLRAKAGQLWKHSVHVAALSNDIGRKVTRVDADTAMFAGIVHEVSGFYLLGQSENMPGLFQQLAGDVSSLQSISRALMCKLSVPDAVAEAIATIHGASVNLPPDGLRDTLLLAKALAPLQSPLRPAQSNTTAELQQYLDTDVTLREVCSNPSPEARSLIAALLS